VKKLRRILLAGNAAWLATSVLPAWSAPPYAATKSRVANRGRPPDNFLRELVDWGRAAKDEIFAVNSVADVYASLKPQLGPYRDLPHRRAVMLEVLRVHAGFESSWNWDAGVHESKPEPNTERTEEAGAFQCSCNSLGLGADLRTLFAARSPGDTSCRAFIRVSKQEHVFAMEYNARLLRHTLQHHGPLKRREVNAWVRRDAVAEFEKLLAG
jgi:hypothetical protein